jgi:hypothetical protein
LASLGDALHIATSSAAKANRLKAGGFNPAMEKKYDADKRLPN